MVSSADFIRNIGYWQTEALRAPVTITHHGRARLVLAEPIMLRDDVRSDDSDDTAEMLALRVKHAHLLEGLRETFIAFDKNLTVCAVNAMAESFCNCASAELMGASITQVMPHPLAQAIAGRLQRVVRTRTAETLEAVARDGRFFVISAFPYAAGVALLIEDQTVERTAVIACEQVKALEAATRASASVASLKLDQAGRVEGIDEQLCTWIKSAPEDVIGREFTYLVTPAQKGLAAELVQNVLRDGRSEQIELTMGPENDERNCAFSFAPILIDFAPQGAMAVCARSLKN